MQKSIMPAVFVGHGSPMNAIEDNEFSRSWKEIPKNIPTPKAILCISAHWETEGTAVTAQEIPETIHDFGGFPQQLYDVQYPAPGDPQLAYQIAKNLAPESIQLSSNWGLDHGTWSVLTNMYPKANIPVVQLSLDRTKSAQVHFDLGKQLFPLREQGVLIIGSGNLVHNLGILNWQDDKVYDWAVKFDDKIKKLIIKKDFPLIINYQKITDYELAIPTNEHYLPLLYILALITPTERIKFFNEKITLGSISMRSLIVTV